MACLRFLPMILIMFDGNRIEFFNRITTTTYTHSAMMISLISLSLSLYLLSSPFGRLDGLSGGL